MMVMFCEDYRKEILSHFKEEDHEHALLCLGLVYELVYFPEDLPIEDVLDLINRYWSRDGVNI